MTLSPGSLVLGDHVEWRGGEYVVVELESGSGFVTVAPAHPSEELHKIMRFLHLKGERVLAAYLKPWEGV